MRTTPSPRIGRPLASALVAVALAAGPIAPAGAAERQRALLSLEVNGLDRGQILVLFENGEVWAEVTALEDAGLHDVPGRRERIGDREFVALSTLAPAIAYSLDEVAVALRLTAPSSAFGSLERRLENGRPPDIQYRRDTSAFLNYAIHVQPGAGFDAATELGVSLGGALLQTTASRLASGIIVRGDTSLVVDDRHGLRRWIVGDSLASTGSLGGAAAIAGVTLARDFELDPYFIRHPTLGFRSALRTPSTVEVYVNNVLVDRQDLPPGDVSLTGLAVPRGTGEARVVIRDAFGREQEISSTYYMTTSLLGEGMHEYRYTAGALRDRSDASGFSYGDPVFMGAHRYGLNDRVTLGFRAEASPALWSAGPSIGVQLGRFGEAEIDWSASRHNGRPGMGLYGAYRFSASSFNVGGFARLLSDDYAAVGLDAASRSELDAGATLGLRVGPRATVSLQHVIVTKLPDAMSASRSDEQRTSLFLQSQVNRWAALFVLAGHTWTGDKGRSEAVFGLNLSVGTASGALSVLADADEVRPSLDLLRSLPRGNGYGYRVHASDPDSEPAVAAFQYQGPHGRYEIDQRASQGGQATVLGVAGSLVAVGGSLFAARPVEQSFALIRVPGVAGVQGYSSNQPIGRTNRHGEVLVTDLLPYYGNLLGIADEDIPLSYRIDGTRQIVAPPYRGGAVVEFPVHEVRILVGSVLLRADSGALVPAQGDLTITAGGRRFVSPLGHHGEFYLENVPPGTHEATIADGLRACRFSVTVPRSRDEVVRLERLVCVPGRETP